MIALYDMLNLVEIPDKYKELFAKDCITIESGHLVYWPESTHGYLDEYYLVLLAAYLHQKNKPWDEQIERDLGG